MTRRLQYQIDDQHNGQSIKMFLQEKEYSRGVLIELKKTKEGIRKNGIWAGVNETLRAGDVLEICLSEQEASENIVPRACELDILYEDEDILVINKPYDMPIHPSVNNYENTLANGIMHYYKVQNKPHVFRCINRLDRDTTGVTILAKNLISASILSNRMREGGLSRIYIAFVEGIIQEEGTVDLPIGRAEDSIIKRKIDAKEGKRAVTHYHRLEVLEVEGKPVSVVALKLDTGRTHQIRVHMSAIGHPLLGDFLYNETNHMLTRQALHGAQCVWRHPITGVFMKVAAPLPKDMVQLMQHLPDLEQRLTQLWHKLEEIK